MCIHAEMSFPERIDIDVKMDIHERIGNPAKVDTDASMKIHTKINTHAKMGTHAHLAKDGHPCKQLRILANQETCRCNWRTKQKEHVQVKLRQEISDLRTFSCIVVKLGNSERGRAEDHWS